MSMFGHRRCKGARGRWVGSGTAILAADHGLEARATSGGTRRGGGRLRWLAAVTLSAAILASPDARAAAGVWEPTGLLGVWVEDIVATSQGDVWALGVPAPPGWSGGHPDEWFSVAPQILWRSTDGGRTWAVMATDTQTAERGKAPVLAVDDADYVWLGTDLLYRWSPDGEGPTTYSLKARSTYSPKLLLDGNLYVIAWGSLFRTRDHGRSWEEFHPNVSLWDVTMDRAGFFYGVCPGVYRASGVDQSWENVKMLLGEPGAAARVAVSASDTVFVAYALYFDRMVLRSTDRGANWTMALPAQATDFHMEPDQDVIYIGRVCEGGVNRSLDDGRTWSPVGEGLPEGLPGAEAPSIVAVASDRNGALYAGNTVMWPLWEGGVYRMELPENPFGWEALGLAGRRVSDLEQSGGILYAATDGGVFRGEVSPTTGTLWAPLGLEGENVSALLVNPSSPNVMYAGIARADEATSPTDVATLYKSTDGGASWSVSDAGTHGRPVHFIEGCGDAASVLYAAGGLGVLRSDDAGTSWSVVLGTGGETISAIRALALQPVRGEVVYAGGSRGASDPALWRSRNGGASWTDLSDAFEAGEGGVQAIGFDPRSTGTLYITTESRSYRSADAGETLAPLRTPCPAYARAILIDPRNSDHVYASGLRGGFFESWDGGESWWEFPKPDGRGGVLSMKVDEADSSILYVGTGERGVFRCADARLAGPTPIPTPAQTPTPIPSWTPTPGTTRTSTPTPSATATSTPFTTGTPTGMPTPDGRAIEELIRSFYQLALGRDPEPGAVDAWQTYFDYALDFDIDVRFVPREMARLFFLSEEYAARNRTDAEFLADCYRVFLDREPTRTELDNWLDGAWNRAQAMTVFSESEEFGNRIRAMYPDLGGDPTRNFVAVMYIGMLDRLVDKEGVEYAAGVFDAERARGGIEAVRAQAKQMVREMILSVIEFIPVPPEDYVPRFYRTFLGRFPNDAETVYWTIELGAGRETTDSLIDCFADSEEFTARLTRFFGTGYRC